MKDYESELKSCGIPVTTSIIVCFYFPPEVLDAIIESMTRSDDHHVDQLQSESTPRSC